jgi:DNA-binding NtrC family response regulator
MMNKQGYNLFVVDDNQLVVTGIRNFLENRFGASLNITTFLTGASALKEINKDTKMVILDYHLVGENGNDVLASIKKINPETKVIMLSSNETIEIAIESYQKGASSYIVKSNKALKKVMLHVYWSITKPLVKMGKELGLNKFMLIFLATFIIVGLLVWMVLGLIPE